MSRPYETQSGRRGGRRHASVRGPTARRDRGLGLRISAVAALAAALGKPSLALAGNWGESWGELVWGLPAVATPVLSPGGLAALALLLVLAPRAVGSLRRRLGR